MSMGFQDRDYYREDRPGWMSGPIGWLLDGRVKLFEVFGITIQIHSSLIVLMALVILLGTGFGTTPQDRVIFVTMLFVIILLHEFGHCLASRWTGGEAREILMWPLGGLASVEPVRRPWPTFAAVAGGPAVNVIICVVAGAVLFLTTGNWPLGPFSLGESRPTPGWFEVSFYAWSIYSISYALLLFNLLPIFPLDGGQMLQAILWKPFGWYRAMLWTVTFGLPAAAIMALVGLTTSLMLAFIAIWAFMNCLRMRRMLTAEGPWAFSEFDQDAYGQPTPTLSERLADRRERNRAEKQRRQRELEQRLAAEAEAKLDAILAKISRGGMDSLSAAEKAFLEASSRHKREHSSRRPGPG